MGREGHYQFRLCASEAEIGKNTPCSNKLFYLCGGAWFMNRLLEISSFLVAMFTLCTVWSWPGTELYSLELFQTALMRAVRLNQN